MCMSVFFYIICSLGIQCGQQRKNFIVQGNLLFLTVHMTINTLNPFESLNPWICCSRNVSDYYQCWKQLCLFIFLWKRWHILRFLWWIESSKEQHLFEMFCNIINVGISADKQLIASKIKKNVYIICVYTVYMCVYIYIYIYIIQIHAYILYIINIHSTHTYIL